MTASMRHAGADATDGKLKPYTGVVSSVEDLGAWARWGGDGA